MSIKSSLVGEMSDSDAVLWTVGRDPVLRSPIVAVMLLDEEPDWEIGLARVERLTAIEPRLRARVVPQPYRLGNPQWVDDGSFELAHHVHQVGAPPPGTFRAVLDLAQLMGTERVRSGTSAVGGGTGRRAGRWSSRADHEDSPFRHRWDCRRRAPPQSARRRAPPSRSRAPGAARTHRHRSGRHRTGPWGGCRRVAPDRAVRSPPIADPVGDRTCWCNGAPLRDRRSFRSPPLRLVWHSRDGCPFPRAPSSTRSDTPVPNTSGDAESVATSTPLT